MLMVIFGAGASFDSSPDYPAPGVGSSDPPDVAACRPPLANSLFDKRAIFVETVDEFPWCKTVVPRLRDRIVRDGRISIERRLEEIREEAKTYSRAAQELAAVRCYLQRALWKCGAAWASVTHGITHQLELLREIDMANSRREPVCLVTFNYDKMIEEALLQLNPSHNIGRMEDYTSDARLFRLFKLHGSVNWGLEFEGEDRWPSGASEDKVGRFVVDRALKLRDPDLYVFSDARTLLSVGRHPVFPAIAIPVEVKNDFQCPRSMLDELKRLMPDVTRVIVIGWRAAGAHYLELMDNCLKPGVRVFVVAGNQQQAEGVRGRIERGTPHARPDCAAESVVGFTVFMRSGLATRILSG